MICIALLIFGCVAWFYRCADMWLCFALVLCVGSYVFVLHGLYRVVDIWLCFMGCIGLLIFACVLHALSFC